MNTFVTLDMYYHIVLLMDCTSVSMCFESCALMPITVSEKQAFGSPPEIYVSFHDTSEHADV